MMSPTAAIVTSPGAAWGSIAGAEDATIRKKRIRSELGFRRRMGLMIIGTAAKGNRK
jgi:hypothetical protein